MARVDYFLKIDGIKGESRDSQHKDEIDVVSFSWGVTHSGITSWEHQLEFRAGKVTMTDYQFETPVNKASPALFLACASGQHIKQATFVGEVSDFEGERRQFLKYTFSDILVASYKEGGTSNGVMDAAALNFAGVKTETTPGTRIDIAPQSAGSLRLDPTTGQVIVLESSSGLLMSGPSLGRDGDSGFDRGVVEYALTDVLGLVTGPNPCTLTLDVREVRQPDETPGGEDPEELPEARRRAPGPLRKVSRHDVFWYGPADLELTPDDYSRQAHRLGSFQADPSGEPAAVSFDLCEIVKKHRLESVGIRIQAAMDHTVPTEDDGESPPPEPENGPPFVIDPAIFTLDLSLELN